MPPLNGRLTTIIGTSIFVTLDILLCVLFLCYHGNTFDWTNFSSQFSRSYSFLISSIDFFILTLLRTILFIVGCSILCLAKDPLYLLQWGKHISFSLCILFCSFSPTKVLALFENKNQPFIGDWLLVFQNIIFSVGGHILWKSYVQKASIKQRQYQELDEDVEEKEEDVEEFGKPSSTSVIILRLLQYCRDEWIWHVSGFTWLFIYSLSK